MSTSHIFIDNLTAKERVDLLAGMRQRDKRETASEASSVGSLFESQLRLLGRFSDADQVGAIVNQLLTKGE